MNLSDRGVGILRHNWPDTLAWRLMFQVKPEAVFGCHWIIHPWLIPETPLAETFSGSSPALVTHTIPHYRVMKPIILVVVIPLD